MKVSRLLSTILCLGAILCLFTPQYGKEFNPKKARVLLKLLLKRPNNKYLFEKVYTTYAKGGKVSLLIQTVQKEAEQKKDANSWFVLGKIYRRKLLLEDASKALEKAYSLNPKNIQVLLLWGKTLYENGQNKKAVQILSQGFSLTSKVEEKQKLYRLLGELYILEGNREKALEMWSQVLQKGNRTPQMLKEMLHLYEQHGFYKPAIELAKEIIRRSSMHLSFQYRMRLKLAGLYARGGFPRKAIETYRGIIENTRQGNWIRKEAIQELFSLCEKEGNLDELKAYYQKRISKNPKEVENYLLYARILLIQKDPDLPIFVRKSLSSFPKEHRFYKILIAYYQGQDNREKLVATIKEYFSKEPKRWKLILHACQTFLAEEEEEKAYELARFLLKKKQETGIYYHLAKVFFHYKAYSKSLEFIRRAYQNRPKDRRIAILAGKIFIKNGKKEKGRDIWIKLGLAHLEDPFLIQEVSLLLYQNKFYTTALKLLEQGLAAHPGDVNLLYQKGNVYRKLKKETEALVAFREAYENAKTDRERRKIRKSLIALYLKADLLPKLIEEFEARYAKTGKDSLLEALAEMYIANNQFKKGKETYLKILTKNPHHLQARKALARLLEKSKDKLDQEEAVKQYLFLAKKNPTLKAQYYLWIGNLYYQKKTPESKKQAYQFYEKARKARPITSTICYQLAQIYRYKLNDKKKSIELYKKAIELDSSKDIYHFELAELYGEEGKWELSLDEYSKVVEMKGEANLVQTSLQKIFQYTLEICEKLEKSKKWKKFESIVLKALVHSWQREEKATLLCLLVKARSHLPSTKPFQIVPLLQKLAVRYGREQVKMSPDFEMNAFFFVKSIFDKLGATYRKYYENRYGDIGKGLFLAAKKDQTLKRDERKEIYEKILATYPFSIWAGKAGLALAKEAASPFVKQEIFARILAGEITSDASTFVQAGKQYYHLLKKLGEKKQIQELLRRYQKSNPFFFFFLKKENSKNLISHLKIQKISPPLTLKWKRSIPTGFGKKPIFWKGRILYPRDYQHLLCYDTEGNPGYLSKGETTHLLPFETTSARAFQKRYFLYFNGVVYKDLFIFGGEKLTASKIGIQESQKSRKVVWELGEINEKIKVDLLGGLSLTASLLELNSRNMILRTEKGKKLIIPRKKVLKWESTKNTQKRIKIKKLFTEILKLEKEVQSLLRKYRQNPNLRNKLIQKQRELSLLRSRYRAFTGSWSFRSPPVTNFYGQPLLYHGRIYVYEAIHQWLFCVEAATGRLIWLKRFPMGGIYQPPLNNPMDMIGQFHPMMKAVENNLYILGDHLYKISALNGQTKWVRKFSNYGRGLTFSSFAYLKKKLYVANRSSRTLILLNENGRILKKKRFSSYLILHAQNGRLAGYHSRKLFFWSGKNLETLEPNAELRFLRTTLSVPYFLNYSPGLGIIGNQIFLTRTGWLKIFEYQPQSKVNGNEKGVLKLVWEDEDMKKRVQKPNYRYRRGWSYGVRYGSGGNLEGPYFFEGRVYLVSPQHGYFFAYKSLRDVENEIVAKLHKNPKDGKALFQLGNLYFQGKKLDLALRSYLKALSLLRNEAPEWKKVKFKIYKIYLIKGTQLFQKNQILKATSYFRRALAYGNAGKEVGTVKLYLSLCHHIQFVYFWTIAKTIPLSKVILQKKIKENLSLALQGYQYAMQNYFSFDYLNTFSGSSKSFCLRQILSLLENPYGRKFYQLYYQKQIAQSLRLAKSPMDLLDIFLRYPFHPMAIKGLVKAGQMAFQKGNRALALRIYNILEEANSHYPGLIPYPKILWDKARLLVQLKEYSKALEIFLQLEEDFLFQGEILSFDVELAKMRVLVEEEMAKETPFPPLYVDWKKSVGSYYNTYPVSPFYYQGKVYVRFKYRLYIFDAATGQVLRTFSLPYWAYDTSWLNQSIVAGDNKVYISMTNGKILALDSRNLQTEWTFNNSNPLRPSKEIMYHLAYSGPYLLALSTEGMVYCINSLNGTLIWKLRASKDEKGFYLHPSNQRYLSLRKTFYDENYPFMLSKGERLFIVGRTIRAFHVSSGKLLWKKRLAKNISQTYYVHQVKSMGRFLILSDTWGNIFAYNIWSGKLEWKSKAFEGELLYLSLTPSEVHSLTISPNKKILLESLDLYTGKKKLTSYLPIRYQSSYNPGLAILSQGFFVYLFYDKIYVYDLEQREKKIVTLQNRKYAFEELKLLGNTSWRPFRRFYYPSQPILGNGRIFLIDSDGALYVYRGK